MTSEKSSPQPAERTGRPKLPASGLPGPALAVIYPALVLLPLAAAAFLGRPPGTPVSELGSAAGLVAAAMLLLQFLTSGRFETIAGRVGLDITMGFHRFAGIGLCGVLLLHVVAFGTRGGPTLHAMGNRLGHMLLAPSILSGLIAAAAVLALMVLALGRDRLRLRYETFRIGHGVLAAAAVVLLAFHALRHGDYLQAHPSLQIFSLLLFGLALYSILEIWLLRALRAGQRPWNLAGVRSLAPHLWEVTLRQRAGRPFAFRAGQFVWVTFGNAHPMTDHPFSIASAPGELPNLRLVVREAGDMTSTIGSLPDGLPASLDGPHGALTVEGHAFDSLVLVAGGVGIAPIIGILRSLAERGERRPVRVVVATRTAADQIFHDEILALGQRLHLKALHLIDTPEPGWTGAIGPMTREHLQGLMHGVTPARTLALLCGPVPLMEAAADLLERLGVPSDSIRYERFSYAAAGDRKARRTRNAFLVMLAAIAVGIALFATRPLVSG
ncbi:MAG: ferric reductase-like transmembrane domain-containing protein [Geminicoccaceae bacterium]